jgi:hypothetical protein
MDLMAVTHVFNDANEGDCVPRLRVVLIAPEDKRRRHQDVQVEIMRLDASLCGYLKEKKVIIKCQKNKLAIPVFDVAGRKVRSD